MILFHMQEQATGREDISGRTEDSVRTADVDLRAINFPMTELAEGIGGADPTPAGKM